MENLFLQLNSLHNSVFGEGYYIRFDHKSGTWMIDLANGFEGGIIVNNSLEEVLKEAISVCHRLAISKVEV